MKPGTFTQMYVQVVFAVKNRDAVFTKDIRKRVFEYMSGITTNLYINQLSLTEHQAMFIY